MSLKTKKKYNRRRNVTTRRNRIVKKKKKTRRRGRMLTYKGGDDTKTTKLPSILVRRPYYSNEKCIQYMLTGFKPSDLTIDKLKKLPPEILNTYQWLVLTSRNSNVYREQFKPDVKKYIDDINKQNLLKYKELYASLNSDSTINASLKGDLKKMNPAYVAEIVDLGGKDTTIKEVIEYLTGNKIKDSSSASKRDNSR